MNEDKKHMYKIAGRYSALGIEIAAAIVLGALLGDWLDEKFQISPWGLFGGMVVGIGAAVRAVTRMVSAYRRSNKTNEQDKLS